MTLLVNIILELVEIESNYGPHYYYEISFSSVHLSCPRVSEMCYINILKIVLEETHKSKESQYRSADGIPVVAPMRIVVERNVVRYRHYRTVLWFRQRDSKEILIRQGTFGNAVLPYPPYWKKSSFWW